MRVAGCGLEGLGKPVWPFFFVTLPSSRLYGVVYARSAQEILPTYLPIYLVSKAVRAQPAHPPALPASISARCRPPVDASPHTSPRFFPLRGQAVSCFSISVTREGGRGKGWGGGM